MTKLTKHMRGLLDLIASEPYRGVIDSSDTARPHPLDPWVDDLKDRRDTDTFNLAHDLGYLGTGHDSDSDTSTTRLTPTGRAALAQPADREG